MAIQAEDKSTIKSSLNTPETEPVVTDVAQDDNTEEVDPVTGWAKGWLTGTNTSLAKFIDEDDIEKDPLEFDDPTYGMTVGEIMTAKEKGLLDNPEVIPDQVEPVGDDTEHAEKNETKEPAPKSVSVKDDVKPEDGQKQKKSLLSVAFDLPPASPIPPSVSQPKPPVASNRWGLKTEDQAFADTLDDVQKRGLDYAKFVDGKKKGYFSRYLKFLKDEVGKRDEFLKDDPETPLDQNDEYVDWVKKHQPHLSQAEKTIYYEDFLINKAKEEMKQEADMRYETLEQRQRQMEIKPKVEEIQKKYADDLIKAFEVPKSEMETEAPITDMMAVFRKRGVDGLREEYPEDADVLISSYGKTVTLAGELMAINMGAKPFNDMDPTHLELVKKIEGFENDMRTKPQLQKMQINKQGQQWIDRARYKYLPESEKNKYWRLEDNMILTAMQVEARNAINETAIKNRKRIEAAIQKQTGMSLDEIRALKSKMANSVVNQIKQPEENAPSQSKRVTVSRSSGAGPNETSTKSDGHFMDRLFRPIK